MSPDRSLRVLIVAAINGSQLRHMEGTGVTPDVDRPIQIPEHSHSPGLLFVGEFDDGDPSIQLDRPNICLEVVYRGEFRFGICFPAPMRDVLIETSQDLGPAKSRSLVLPNKVPYWLIEVHVGDDRTELFQAWILDSNAPLSESLNPDASSAEKNASAHFFAIACGNASSSRHGRNCSSAGL